MAPVVPDPKKIKAFKTEDAFEAWLRAHHDRETEIWVRIYKKRSGKPTVTNLQAPDVALCWGWLDGIRKSLDADSCLQRYTPRRAQDCITRGDARSRRNHRAGARAKEDRIRLIESLAYSTR